MVSYQHISDKIYADIPIYCGSQHRPVIFANQYIGQAPVNRLSINRGPKSRSCKKLLPSAKHSEPGCAHWLDFISKFKLGLSGLDWN